MEGACVQHGAFINKCGYLNGNIIISPIFKYRESQKAFNGAGKTLRLMKKACTKS